MSLVLTRDEHEMDSRSSGYGAVLIVGAVSRVCHPIVNGYRQQGSLLGALTLYWIIGYKIKEGKVSEFKKFLSSGDFGKIRRNLLEETGIRIVETYFAVEPSSNEQGDYDAWDIWEVPNYAAIDKYVQSKARLDFFENYLAPFVGSSYKWITAARQELSN